MTQKGFLKRWQLIIRKIKRDRFVSLDNLSNYVQQEMALYTNVDKIGLSKRTIQRDIKSISENLGISIEYSKSNNGYYIPEDEEADAGVMSLLERLDLLNVLNMDKGIPSFVFPEKRKPRGTEGISPLIYSIKNSFVVEFFYLKYDNSLSHIRTVEPYGLKEFKERWYLLAMEIGGKPEERGQIKTWGLDRIKDLKITTTKFARNHRFSLEEYFSDSFGIYSDVDKPAEEVVLSFDPQGGRYNDSFPLHHTQKTLLDNDKEFRISLNLKITTDFIMELLSQSENMRVITPEHLRQTLITLHKNSIKLLQKVDLLSDNN